MKKYVYSILYRTCETIYSPAGKWKEAEREIRTREEAEKILAYYEARDGFSYDFDLGIELSKEVML